MSFVNAPYKNVFIIIIIIFIIIIIIIILYLIVFFLVMLNFPFPTFKLFTIVNSFLSWTYI